MMFIKTMFSSEKRVRQTIGTVGRYCKTTVKRLVVTVALRNTKPTKLQVRKTENSQVIGLPILQECLRKARKIMAKGEGSEFCPKRIFGMGISHQSPTDC